MPWLSITWSHLFHKLLTARAKRFLVSVHKIKNEPSISILSSYKLINVFPLKMMQWCEKMEQNQVRKENEVKTSIFNAIIFSWVTRAIWCLVLSCKNNTLFFLFFFFVNFCATDDNTPPQQLFCFGWSLHYRRSSLYRIKYRV